MIIVRLLTIVIKRGGGKSSAAQYFLTKHLVDPIRTPPPISIADTADLILNIAGV